EKLNDPQYFMIIYEELKNHVSELMMDNFGHYVIHSLFSHANDERKIELLKKLINTIVTVCCHKQGSFSIQSIMDMINTKEQIQLLIQILSSDCKKLILNNSGHYVILRFLSRYNYPYTKF